jgi:hypothetical protein
MPVAAQKLRIPAKIWAEALRKGDSLTRHFRVIKPATRLGAGWTSDKVAQRRTVIHCEECWRKYDGWWRKANYRPDWGWNYRGDCDGCGKPFVSCTLFHPDERFYQVFSRNHGINPKP